MAINRFSRIAAVLVGLVAAACWSQAMAATTTQPRKLPSKVTFVEAPSTEKPAAREKRLKRECKGRPNAGMCLGHTR